MGWVLFVAGAVLSWGAYGALLYLGQTQLGNPLKALLCVGVAYFLIGVLLPVGVLGSQGELSGFGMTGLINATIAGALGAIGAACIIWAFKTGGLITGILGIVIMPWKLLADPSGYIFNWLVGYSGGLGSIAGVLITDYWIVRRRELALEDLYVTEGRYGAWNAAGIIATLAGCAVAWIGLIYAPLRVLYDYAWFVGFGTSAGVYLLLARRTEPS